MERAVKLRIRLGMLAAGLTCGSLAGHGAIAQNADPPLVAYRVEHGGIPATLTRDAGDPVRGRTIALSRDSGNCFLCHRFPDAAGTPLGDLGPPLAGVGKRLSAAQLRLRLVDSAQINRTSIMPAYYRVRGLNQVAAVYRGKPLLTAQQIEDVIAYLLTLRD